MPIRKGDDWGRACTAPEGLQVFADDAALGRSVAERRSRGESLSPVGVRRGDLARTLGGGTGDRFAGEVVRGTVDIVRLEVDGDVTWCTSHVVARRFDSWWRGEVWFVMNAQYHGTLDLAPRGHPNDGRVEILHVAARMPWRTRRAALRRARTGTHLPHPLIAVSSAGTKPTAIDFDRPLDVWVDGRRWRRARSMSITVEADAFDLFA
jgi:hypothetical protein